ncbi:bifunctional folylpolyglutamate synthase/dihydrofolate synthase [Urbifossiella limnaea]|uniref:Dihydrofolate synthase/folylpolyglutamate synthase n=1 Tax=Urbifossiella limnaea TaxID=2528023 RepID=A0A517XTV3_9BACT|nr:folylpolyglutamate synthase/dihydrofolate synthase family protein [Urbifossiella limnaea]QDU20932.1 Folylpolyglutamate synthase [Urbifossiella limnaea]
MTYPEALAFWYARVNYEVRAAHPTDLKLERMRALLRRLGDPHERVRLVHVTGTKGKGSTSAMLAAVLRAAGYRVGLFTSPHLTDVRERIQVDDAVITERELAARMTELAPAVAAMDADGFPPPTFFEIGTALGFLHFAYRRCDLAVIEVGLGGRFDSTNVCRPLVSVVTSVGLDHTAQLGGTLEAVAFQKAGIIKPNVPVVSGVTEPGPRDVVRKVAAELAAPVWERGADFGFDYRPGESEGPPVVTISTPRSTYGPTALALLGEHQAHNAALAVAVVDRLRDGGLHVPAAAVAAGLASVVWPGRVEVVRRSPVVILDTAHNVPSAEALVRTLAESFPRVRHRAVVFAVSSDKPVADILRVLARYFDRFHLTRYGNNPRCLPPEESARLLASVAPAAAFALHATAADAWAEARTAATGDDALVCVTGSVFLAGELRPLVLTDRGLSGTGSKS